MFGSGARIGMVGMVIIHRSTPVVLNLVIVKFFAGVDGILGSGIVEFRKDTLISQIIFRGICILITDFVLLFLFYSELVEAFSKFTMAAPKYY